VLLVSDDKNPYEGIAKTTNSTSWQGLSPTEPLSADWLQRGFDALLKHDEAKRQREAEIGAEYREAMKDPKFAARRNAMYQAALDVGCPMPDPLNPPIVHPKLYERLMARTDEILRGE
jgi:hypothetical protein